MEHGLTALKTLYNACLTGGNTPEQWENAVMIILHKKGDITESGNYPHIRLLSPLYKLYMRIITNRLGHKLDFHQLLGQARFRSGFGTNDHLQVIRFLIEKLTEYNKPLILVDFEKAFEKISHTLINFVTNTDFIKGWLHVPNILWNIGGKWLLWTFYLKTYFLSDPGVNNITEYI